MLRGVASFLPIVGPVAGGLDALAERDHIGAGFELCSLALDVCSLGTACIASRLAGRTVMGRSVRPVIKTMLKQKVKRRTKEAVAKLSLAGAQLISERRQAGVDLPFAVAASPDAHLHAILAGAVYLPAEQRRTVSGPGGVEYLYIGGDAQRGFWFAPVLCHLVVSERGTDESQDLVSNVLLLFGAALPAISLRVKHARLALALNVEALSPHHDQLRVTATGHSLGGTIATHLAAVGDSGIETVHAFNPGGVPDLSRSVTCARAAQRVKIHRIRGDVLSAAFIPGQQQSLYRKRVGHDDTNPHASLHFL